MQRPESEELAGLLADFRQFARDIQAQGSLVYTALCQHLADDPQRARVALLAQPAFRTPLILLAAVHHLLLAGTRHPLAAYYPTVAGHGSRPVDDGLYAAFASFLDDHREAVEQLVATRSTQTNEAGRTVVTLPALGLVARRSAAPLALLEVGASAGLNLLPDRYAFRIGDRDAGDQRSPVRLTCAVEGRLRPPLPAEPVAIAWRLGVDLNPLDVAEPGTRSWLRALVWPDQPDRMAILDAALAVARRDPPLVVRGDLTTDLASVAAEAPRHAALVVMSTWVLVYVETGQRRAFLDSLRLLAGVRGAPVWLVAGESMSVLATLGIGIGQPPADGFGPSTLSVHRFDPDGTSEHVLLAECHAHGRWIRWLDAASAAPPT